LEEFLHNVVSPTAIAAAFIESGLSLMKSRNGL
jgi:hypothetical protein